MRQMTLLRVMSFDILVTTLAPDEIGQPSDVWADRADPKARTIRCSAPDPVGLQEVDAGHRASPP